MKKVLIILGPTAVGKTALSIELAKKFNGEIINGDSVQIYKELNIGSAKITHEEMEGIPHHLINIKEVTESFSVAEFQQLVRNLIDEISSRGKLPIICGGTGLYIQAVLYDYKFSKDERQESFKDKYSSLSNEDLHEYFRQFDQKEAQLIPKNNRRRVLRALEIYENHQKSKSELIELQNKDMIYDAYLVGLDMERAQLYERINKRVDLMIEAGLLEEVTNLHNNGHQVNAIGYKEFNEYFNHGKTLEEVKDLIKKNTRHYAKRQLTYFRNKLNVDWFIIDEFHQFSKDVIAKVNLWIH